MSENTTGYQAIIVGAGFAGVAAAKELAKEKVHTLLIDRNNYQQFQPLLYQVASSQLPAGDVAEPLRSVFRTSSTVRVLTADVAEIDATARTVTLADGTVFAAKILVISAGAQVNFFGTPGADEFSYPLYSVDDATRLAAALVAELDAADTAAEEQNASGPVNVIVVGAGPTGVETAGALAEAVQAVVPRYYADGVNERCAVHLVDMGPTVLGPFTEKLQEYTRTRLEQLGVRMHFKTGVKEIRADGVTLSDGSTMPARIVIWAGGLRAQSVVATAGVHTGRGGRVDVNADLTVPDFPGVYALGDAANIPDGKGKTLPQLGSVALQSGQWAGRNIVDDLTGVVRARGHRDFVYHDKGFMAMVGRMAAVAEVGAKHRQMHGPLAFAAWLGVHDALLPSTHSRSGALINWYRDYLTNNRTEFVVGAVPAARAGRSRPTPTPTAPPASDAPETASTASSASSTTTDSKEADMQNLTVLGTGVLGSQIIFQAAYSGKNVVAYDINDDILAKLPARWEYLKPQYLEDLPDATAEKLDAAVARIRATSDLADALHDADIVIEAVPERLDIKRDTWQKVSAAAPAKTVFCTNSSTLLPSQIAPFTDRPEKFLATHFANQVWIFNTCEVMGHDGTDAAVFESAAQFAEQIGMVPIRIRKEQPGYVLNSLLVPFLGAAAKLRVRDIASVEDVDKTWRISTGSPLGPFQIYDIVGMMTPYNLNKDSDDPEMKEFADHIKTEYIDKGYLGKGSGRGFYTYE